MIAATLILLAIGVAGFAVYAPQIRDTWYFEPERQKAEKAMDQLAQAERNMRKRTGAFDSFTTGEAAAHLQKLGLSASPAESYLFDAVATPDKGVRLRALPRAEQVRALKVSARMYVAQLSSGGEVLQRGWLP